MMRMWWSGFASCVVVIIAVTVSLIMDGLFWLWDHT